MRKHRWYIVEGPGMHGTGQLVYPVRRSNMALSKVEAEARRLSRARQTAMKPHGGGGGYYRVVRGDSYFQYGHDLDRVPTARS